MTLSKIGVNQNSLLRLFMIFCKLAKLNYGKKMKKLALSFMLTLVLGGFLGQYPDNIYLQIAITITSIYILYLIIIIPLRWLSILLKKLFGWGEKPKEQSSQKPSIISKQKSDVMTNSDVEKNLGSSNSQTLMAKDIMMEHLIPKHQLMLVSINKSVTDGHAIYDAARFAWRVNVARAREADYVLAHQSGTVVGVFKAYDWLPADSGEFSGLSTTPDPSRWGFVGEIAPSEVLLQYFNKKLPDGFSKKGASNPVRFLAAEDNVTEVEKHPNSAAGLKGLSASSVGCIDSDGDFFAELKIDISKWGHDQSIVYAEGDIEATIGNECEFSSTYSEAEVLDGELSIRSGYIRVDESIDPDYKVTAELKIFQFSEPGSLQVTLPKKDGDLVVDYTSNGLKVSKISFEWQHDDDMCNIEISALGEAPYCVLISARLTEDGEAYPSQRDIRMSEEDTGVFYADIYDCAPGNDVTITIEVADRIHIESVISSAGRAEIEERSSQTDEDEDEDFFGDDDDDDGSISPFVFCFDQAELEEVASETGSAAAKNKLLSEMSMFMGAVTDCLDGEARFFINNEKELPVEVFDRDNIEKVWGLVDHENLAAWLDARSKMAYVHITVIISGTNHWDDGFLRVSSYEGVANFYVWGMYTPIGEVANQGYCDGDFDSGIAADPDDDSYYFGQTSMDHYSVKEAQFELETYGLAD